MTARAKIAVTLPQPLVAAARSAVEEGRAASVSAYVAAALQQHVMQDDLDALLSELLEQSGGPLTDAEREAIDRTAGWAP